MKRILHLSFGRSGMERDVERELSLHLELRVSELMAQGLTPAEARRAAEASFGDVAEITEECVTIRRARERDRARRGVIDALSQDMVYAVRVLRRAPAFSAIAILTLALGIGGSASLFSVVHALLLRPLPFGQADRLVFITETHPAAGERNVGVSLPLAEDIAAHARTLEQVGLFGGARFQVRADLAGAAMLLAAGTVINDDVFGVLGIKPLVGRLPQASEYGVAGSTAVLISYRFWQRVFAGDSSAVGRSLTIGGQPLAIIAVMPPSFSLAAGDMDLWLPATVIPEGFRNRAVHVYTVLGRRLAGVSLAQIQSELRTLYERGQLRDPGSDAGHDLGVLPLRVALVGDVRSAVLILFGAVLTVLLIACGNLAGLQLARATARAPELAMRTVLGAGRVAVIRQQLVESFLVAALGCAGGIALAYMLLPWLVRSYPNQLPLAEAVNIDGRVLLFAIGLTLFAVLLFGLLPALQSASRPRVIPQLLAALRTTPDRPRHRLRSVLVSAELALALVLVMAASLVVRSFVRVQTQNAGFDPTNLHDVQVALTGRITDPEVIAWYERLPERIEALPGVRTASATSSLPISGGDSRGSLTIEGQPFDPGGEPSASYRRVLPNYFRTMGTPLIAGREFGARDRGQDPKVVVVNRTLAVRHFGSAARALGRRIKVGPAESEPWLTIVGVVGDVRNEQLEQNDEYATYEPHAQRPWRTMQLVVRSENDAGSLAPLVRAVLLEGGAEIVISEWTAMTDRIADSLAPRRFNAQLLTGFGFLGLLLAALGVYGIVAVLVNERRREFGIRIALGATANDLAKLVLSRAFRLAVAGVAAGTFVAAAVMRFLASLLFELEPFDPASLASAAILLALVVALAASGPVWQAVRVDVKGALLD